MKRISLRAIGIGVCTLVLGIGEVIIGHPPFSFIEAFFLAGAIAFFSAIGGFEWGLASFIVQAAMAGMFREAWVSAGWLCIIGCLWYVGVTILAVRGSRVLMGIAAGALFAGLLAERMATMSFQQWLFFFALLLLEVSGMYMAGNAIKGRWFSLYA